MSLDSVAERGRHRATAARSAPHKIIGGDTVPSTPPRQFGRLGHARTGIRLVLRGDSGSASVDCLRRQAPPWQGSATPSMPCLMDRVHAARLGHHPSRSGSQTRAPVLHPHHHTTAPTGGITRVSGTEAVPGTALPAFLRDDVERLWRRGCGPLWDLGVRRPCLRHDVALFPRENAGERACTCEGSWSRCGFWSR